MKRLDTNIITYDLVVIASLDVVAHLLGQEEKELVAINAVQGIAFSVRSSLLFRELVEHCPCFFYSICE